MKKNIESMTLAEIKAELNAVADKYNIGTNDAERVECVNEAKKYATAYNELSMHTDYATFVAAEQPIIAIANAYSYGVVSVKVEPVSDVVNGRTVVAMKMSIKEDGVKTHNLVKFLEWAEKHNKKLTANANWRGAMNNARKVINNLWEKQLTSKDGYKMSKTGVKSALQDLFDALVFIKAENSDKNAIIANGKHADFVMALAADLKKSIDNGDVKFTVEFLGNKKWQSLVFDILHMAVKGKTYTVVYAEPDDDTPAEAEATAEAEEK